MDYLKKSRIEEVLIAILGKGVVTSRLISRIEKILDAIRTDGSYDGPVMSEVEEILVCILNGEPFEKPTHSRIAAMLKVKANGGEYTELRKSRVEDLIFEWINAVESATYSGTLPATLRTVAGYLESYKIYGNTEQNGTPTPENPIYSTECGERTGNLFDNSTAVLGKYIDNNGNEQSSSVPSPTQQLNHSNYFSVSPNSTYTFSSVKDIIIQQTVAFVWYTSSRTFISRTTAVKPIGETNYELTATAPENAAYAIINYTTANNEVMLNLGSTALPYEPYGYKLPLTVNGVEYPIYLNEPLCGIGTYTDSLELSTGILTRKIKKLVLTGEETWYFFNLGEVVWQFYTNNIISGLASSSCMSNIAEYGVTGNTRVDYDYGAYLVSSGRGVAFQMRGSKDTFVDVDAWKVYLAQQYAAGTPVTVWYVLAELEISTIPVPSGLTGTIEGYLIQDGTPTPETPIYPTANGVKQADGTYIIPYSVEYPIYLGDAQLAKDEYVDSTTGKIYRRTENLSPPEEEWVDEWIWGDGTVHPSAEIKTSPFIDVSTCETCIMEVFSTETEWAAAGYREMAFYDENKQYLGWMGGGGRQTLTPRSTERLSEFPAGTVYVRISCSHGDQPFYPQLVSGYTPTHQFYPYLVPTDPPVPFPQIPTVAGTTTIDYNGEPKPDKVELTYSKPK